jgi:phosphohistidine phosphatase
MRRLLLLRHAKAERPHEGGRDLDRVLTDRGRDDARTVGAYLARHSRVPDRALVSVAARTRETWALLAEAFPRPPRVDFLDRLYDAEPQAILDAIKETGPETGILLVIGHNPGMQELAGMLIASGDADAREQLSRAFPTSGLASISFAAEGWDGVHVRGGRLEHFVTPKSLTQATD